MAIGQGRFTVNGRMKIEGGDLSNTRVLVLKDGVKERTLSSGLSKFTLDLEIGHDYIIAFEKDGYVSKKISFNTHAPAEAAANGFTPFDFAVSLFKQYDDINLVVFNQPVGMIRYDDKTGDFDYDTDYTKTIQSQLQQVLAQVEERQKEEATTTKASEERAAEEAKAKAKAEGEAQKQAAAKAKTEAAAAKRAEEERAVAQREAEAHAKEAARPSVPEPVKPPPPAEVLAEKPTPRVEKQVTPVVSRPVLASKPFAGEDTRRSITPVIHQEASRVERARMHASEEVRPKLAEAISEVQVNQHTVVEPSRVTTIVSVSEGEQVDEYRKVIHKWGGLFYFKNGATCTAEVFQQGTRVGDLAGAMPRAKLD